MDELLRNAGPSRFLTAEERTALGVHVVRFLMGYSVLSAHALRDGSKAWKIVPKFHMLTHVAYDCPLNGRRTHVYPDEDMVGRVKKIYTSCHPLSAGRRTVQRYSLLVSIRWWAVVCELRGLPRGVKRARAL